VECAWGELVTSTTVTEGTEVLVVGDLTVPESTVLTLEQGSSLVMNDEDLDEDGTDEDLVEFVVNGSLVATGTAQDPVTIQGEVSGPSSWWGIRTGSSGSVGLENVGLEDYYLFLIQTADTCYVVDCDLRNWDAWGLVLGLGGGSMHALVQGNEFRSHEGTTALLLDSSTDGVQVTENYFYGDEPAAYGIHVFQNTSSPLISGNYFTDYSGNEAIHINSGSPDLVNNTFEECEVGILVSGGTPRIGLGSSSDNVIDGNDVGIWVTGGVPVLRNNQITSNYGYGVLVSEGADPDLGVQNDPGLNTLTGNYVCIKNNNPGGSPTVRARGNYLGVCDSHGYLYDPCWEGNVDVEDLECDPLASWSPEISVVTPGLRILGAQPNPMASGCGIYFDLAGVTGVVTSAVYDVAGRLVRALPEMAVEPGRHWIGWDGLDDGGRRTGSGMYFVKVSANGTYSGTAKVLVAN